MTRSKWVLCLALVGVIGACGGRNGLRPGAGDGGAGSSDARGDGKTSDGKQDGVRTDARLDVLPTDARLDGLDARLDVVTDARLDVRQTDGRPDVPTDYRGPDGNSDGRDGGRDVPPFTTDGPRDVRGDRVGDGITDGGPVVTLSSIEISPAAVTVNLGTPSAVKITAVYSDNTSKDVSTSATVTSGDTSVLTVSGITLTGVKAGTTSITASYQGKTATANVTVVDNNPLTSITIDAIPNLAIGGTANLVATGVFANGSKQDVTVLASWTSANPAIVTVGDSAATKGQVKGITSGGPVVVTASIATATGNVSGTVNITVDPKKLLSIQITPTNPTLTQGEGQAFIATGTYDDGSTGNVTQQATWSSDTTSVLTIVASGANAGRAQAVGQGSATISAVIGEIKATPVIVTVSGVRLVRIVVTGQASINLGSTQPYTAEGQYADQSTKDITTSVTWSSSATAILSISNAAGTQGVATGIAAGTANVRATLGTVSGQLAVTVFDQPLRSIAVTPNPLDNLVVGLTRPLTANATYGDAPNTIILDVTTSATWTVDDATVATVGTSSTTAGRVTGVKAGSAKVTATLSGTSGTATVNVTNPTLDSITVTPETANVRAGRSVNFKATGNYSNSTTVDLSNDATWTSSNTAVAQVSDATGTKGTATGVAASATAVTITATYKTIKGTASLTVTEPHIVSIRVTPTSATLDVGATQGLTVTGVYENGTTTNNLTGVNWSSSNEAVATVTANPGRPGAGGGATVTAKTKGTAIITASYTPTGETTALTDSSVITVTEQATPVKIRLTPASASIPVDGTLMYTVYLDYSDGTTQTLLTGVTLTSSNGSVVSVAGGGRGGGPGGLAVTGVGPGSATITASYTAGNMTDTAQITVYEKPMKGFFITPSSASVKVGGTQQFQAFVTYEDGTSAQVGGGVSWTTSDGNLATVSGNGLVTASAAGEVKVQASYSGQTASAILSITAPKPTGLVITPSTGTLYLDGTMNFVANLIYDDNTSANVTATAMWSSNNASVVVLSNNTGGRGGGPGGGGLQGGGTATGIGVGTATITAVYTTDTGEQLRGTAAVTVTDPPIKELQISPTKPTVTLASPNVQFTATVIYTDFSTRNVTNTATWSSSNSGIALVSNGGRATAVAKGTATITVSYSGATASTDLTVADKKVSTLQVTPTNPTTHLGVNKSFVAVAVYDDNSTATVTSAATWTSSVTTVASVGTTGGTGGVATPLSAGKSVITATYQGVSGSSELTVSASALQTIAITPTPLYPPLGSTQQLTATGTYADGSENLTDVVTWLSENTGIAAVSNASGSRGMLTAVSNGTTTIRAHFQSVTGTLSVNVGGTPVYPDAAVSD